MVCYYSDNPDDTKVPSADAIKSEAHAYEAGLMDRRSITGQYQCLRRIVSSNPLAESCMNPQAFRDRTLTHKKIP
jgi:hypothetical protein